MENLSAFANEQDIASKAPEAIAAFQQRRNGRRASRTRAAPGRPEPVHAYSVQCFSLPTPAQSTSRLQSEPGYAGSLAGPAQGAAVQCTQSVYRFGNSICKSLLS